MSQETWTPKQYGKYVQEECEGSEPGALIRQKRTRVQREQQYVQLPIEAELERFEWTYYHAHQPQWDKPGFPDLLLWKEIGIRCFDLLVECKYGNEQPTKEQEAWLTHYRRHWEGDPYSWACIWRETDLLAIHHYLRDPFESQGQPPGIWKG